MADVGLFEKVSGEFVGRIFSGILWFGVAILVVSVLGFLMWYFLIYQRKFDIKVKIKSNRAEDKHSIIFDKAAILLHYKTKMPYFRIWELKRNFPVPKYNVIQSTNHGDYLEIYRQSEEEFYYLTPARINNKRIIHSDGKYHAMADQEQTLYDPDIMSWALNRMEEDTNMFSVNKVWMQLIPYIPHIMGGVITIFILYLLMDSLPQILNSMKELAEILNNAQRAQTIVG